MSAVVLCQLYAKPLILDHRAYLQVLIGCCPVTLHSESFPFFLAWRDWGCGFLRLLSRQTCRCGHVVLVSLLFCVILQHLRMRTVQPHTESRQLCYYATYSKHHLGFDQATYNGTHLRNHIRVLHKETVSLLRRVIKWRGAYLFDIVNTTEEFGGNSVQLE